MQYYLMMEAASVCTMLERNSSHYAATMETGLFSLACALRLVIVQLE